MFVHQQPHQLRHRDGGVGIVELDREALMEAVQIFSPQQVNMDHILQRTGNEEVLLRQPEHFPHCGLVIGVEHLGDGLRDHLFLDGAVVVSNVEVSKIEGLHRFRFP